MQKQKSRLRKCKSSEGERKCKSRNLARANAKVGRANANVIVRSHGWIFCEHKCWSMMNNSEIRMPLI